jgi:hypothetical protein
VNFFTKLVEFLMPKKKQNQYNKPQEPPKTYTNTPKATSTTYSSTVTSSRVNPRESSQVYQRDTFDDDVVPNTLILSTLANSASTDTRHDTPLSTKVDSCEEKITPSFDTSWSSSSSSDSTSTSDSGGGCSSSD